MTAVTARLSSSAVLLSLTAFTAFALLSATPAQAQKHAPAKTHTAPAPVASKTPSGFTKWSDPKEGAFSVDVPTGWKVAGGIKRVAPTDVRQTVVAQSPDQNMTVVFGDVSLPLFVTISPIDQAIGAREGASAPTNGNYQAVFLHYMPAPEFNKWYIKNALSQLMNDTEAGKEYNNPAVAQKMEVGLRRQMGGKTQVRVTLCATEFTGKDKETGLPVSGLLWSSTQYMGNGGAGSGGSWYVTPIVVAVRDDENKEARIKQVGAAMQQMQKSWRANPVWQRKENARTAAIIKKTLAQQQAQIRAAQKASHGGGGGGVVSSGGSNASMAAYWRRNAQRDAQQHQFINYLRDEKDIVVDGRVTTVPDN